MWGIGHAIPIEARDIGFIELELQTDSCELPAWGWELNSESLEEQYSFLAVKPSL